MGLFGKSFEEKVEEALVQVRVKVPGVKNLAARVDGKVVTLTGETSDPEAKARAIREFDALVQTDNTLNTIRVERPAPAKPGPVVVAAAPSPTTTKAGPVMAEAAPTRAEQWHEVVKGDTLSALAKKYYGKASLYTKIFEANRDQLKDPDVIKIGQKLRIPPAGGPGVA